MNNNNDNINLDIISSGDVDHTYKIDVNNGMAMNDNNELSEQQLLPSEWNKYLDENIKNITPVTKPKDMALAFLLQKDKIKINLKEILNRELKLHPDKKDFIGKLFNSKLSFKEFKHLNFASKRIVLNNVLRNKLIVHTALTNETTNDILIYLENDSTNYAYLHNIKIAFEKIVERKIKLK